MRPNRVAPHQLLSDLQGKIGVDTTGSIDRGEFLQLSFRISGLLA
jgi:hypothetical protein